MYICKAIALTIFRMLHIQCQHYHFQAWRLVGIHLDTLMSHRLHLFTVNATYVLLLVYTILVVWGRNPDWMIAMANYVCMYLLDYGHFTVAKFGYISSQPDIVWHTALTHLAFYDFFFVFPNYLKTFYWPKIW